MSGEKLQTYTLAQIEDAWSIARKEDREKIARMKFVSVETLKQLLKEHIKNWRETKNPSKSFVIVELEQLLACLEGES